jgi:putative transposase
MSRKRTSYSTEFKTKLVLEVLRGEKTLNEIASANNVLPKNLQNWKNTFLENAELAMDPSKAVREYKEENQILRDKVEKYAKTVGKMTVENEWLVEKLQSLDLSTKIEIVDVQAQKLSLSHQTQLLGINRGHFYYTPSENHKAELLKDHLQEIYLDAPMYGERKVHQHLREKGFGVSLNTVSKYRKELNLRAVLAVKSVQTTIPKAKDQKYPYQLRDLEITEANQVWSTDITYIKTARGTAYMPAIIDWYSKAVLSYGISNCMDTDLVMRVLDDALTKYGQPEIFNSDQGSQYTSHAHTNALLSRNITISMDGKGRATDNIAIERFWRSVKCEMIYLNEYGSIASLRNDAHTYMEFYNTKRFHQSLGYRKPMDVYYESLMQQGKMKLMNVA